MVTIVTLEIRIIDINVIPNDAHLGIRRKSLILPVIVQRAIAITIDAKNSIITSFKPHIINIEMIRAINDRSVLVFKLII